MPKPIAGFALAFALLTCLPGVALARSGASAPASASSGVGLPIVAPSSATTPPPGFSTDANQAITAAEASRMMVALHAREHPLAIAVSVWSGQRWFVDFSYRGRRVAEVVEDRAARVTGVWTGPLAVAVYARGRFLPLFGSWWVLVPFSLLFLVPFLGALDPRRRWRTLPLDALVLESFLVSYLLFDHALLEPAVWLVYPPLLYLLARMLWIGGRGGAGVRGARRRALARRHEPWARGIGHKVSSALSPLLSVRVLGAGLIALVALRTGLSLIEHEVGDVGYASVIGAHRIASGQPLYYVSIAHGDTYGPVAYLAYLPFELLFPWHGAWDYLASAHVASVVFDLVTVLGLVGVGRRLRGGREGLRLGLALGWAWAACPLTLLALLMHTNDGLAAMLSVLSLLAFSSPAARGALLGLAAAVKFAPAALLGLFAGDRDRGLKGVVVCLGSFALVVVTAVALYLPSGGLTEFYNHTLGFQLTRLDVFSPWAMHPSLAPLKLTLEVCALALCAGVAFVPRRRRSLPQVCALAGALTIAVELPAEHWFYYFVVWFMPFVLVALLARGDDAGGVIEAPGAAVAAPPNTAARPAESVHAGV